MKKILLAVMAVAAIGFTSCGNKTQQADAETAAVDSVAIVDSIAQGAAQETIDALSADLEANDVSKLQATLESIKVKIAEIVKTEDAAADRYYLVKFMFFTIDERTANGKRTAVFHLVQAKDFDDAKRRAAENMSGTMADWEIDTIKETKYIDVY